MLECQVPQSTGIGCDNRRLDRTYATPKLRGPARNRGAAETALFEANCFTARVFDPDLDGVGLILPDQPFAIALLRDTDG